MDFIYNSLQSHSQQGGLKRRKWVVWDWLSSFHPFKCTFSLSLLAKVYYCNTAFGREVTTPTTVPTRQTWTSLLSAFSNTTVDYGFHNSSAGQVKAFALCRGDLTPNTCRNCIGTSSHELRRLCPNYKEAYIYYDNCMLGYSNRSIVSINKLSPIYISAKLFKTLRQFNEIFKWKEE